MHGTNSRLICRLAIVGTTFALAGTAASAAPFRRADFNQDARHDIADAVSVLEYLFLGGGDPGCLDAGDTNDDGTLDIADAVASLGYLFLGAPPPASPYPDCGTDVTRDALDCIRHQACHVPNLSEVAGHCGGVPASEHPNSLQPGDELRRVTLDDALAVCNDGSPGVFYVRAAAPDRVAADRWVIYLQGGGSCGSFTECLDRWCGRQSSAYNESKMSSIYCPNAIGSQGIFRSDEIDGATSAFSDFNQVYLYYCSSDGWSGRNSNSVLTDPEDPERQYSLHFRGHDIARAVIARLLAGGVVSDDGAVAMPSLADAELALVTGFSAGGSGLIYNGDWITDQLEPQGTTVRLVLDSAFPPPAATHPDPVAARELEVALALQVTARWASLYSPGGIYNAFADESARTTLEETSDEWRLADNAYITHNHITTPYFVHIDLFDRQTRGRYLEVGVSPADFEAMVATTLEEVPLIAQRAVEAAAIALPGGSFGPLCADHAGLMTDSVYFTRTVADPGGFPRSYQETLLRWLQGSAVTLVDDPDAPTTVCGEPPEENE